jgi:hypothetical protein
MKIPIVASPNSNTEACDYSRPWTKDEVQLLQKLSESGVPKYLIAKTLGRSYTTVSLKAVELGIKAFR